MSLENPSTAVGPLISTPDSPLSNAIPTLMVTWDVEEFFGGMTSMCIKRAHIFHGLGVPSAVVTFAPNPDFSRIRTSLIERGKLSADVPIVNMHEFYDQNYPGKAGPGFKAVNLDSVSWNDPQDIFRTTDQSLFSREFTAESPVALRRNEYFRHDGSLYLIDCTVPQIKDPSKTKRILQLCGADSAPVAEFTSAAKLYRHWLSELVGTTDTNVIVDSKYSAGFLGLWKHPGAVKLYPFHSTHLAPGEDTLTGNLSKAHAPIIEQRHEWDGLVFLTKSQQRAFTQRFGDDAHSYVIGNPTQRPANYPPADQRQTGKTVCVGRLAGGKNVDEVINIINLVRQSGEAVSLDIIGDGSQREALETQVHELGLEDSVKFLGHVNSVAEHLEQASFLLMCSSYEGQSLAILEAQAHGCIPVAYDVDFGPRDVIENGVSGFLVPFKDKKSAASIIQRLLNDEQLRATVSHTAFIRAEDFNEKSTFNRWQQALTSAREGRMLTTLLSEIKPVLTSMTFLANGAIKLTLEWEEQQLDFDSLQLLVEPRGTSSLESRVVIDPSALSNGSASFSIPSDIRTTIAAKEPLDLSVRLRSGDAQAVLRLGAPKGQMLQPYLTAYGNLSLK